MSRFLCLFDTQDNTIYHNSTFAYSIMISGWRREIRKCTGLCKIKKKKFDDLVMSKRLNNNKKFYFWICTFPGIKSMVLTGPNDFSRHCFNDPLSISFVKGPM